MTKRIVALLAAGLLGFGAMGAGHGGQASDNANCLAQERSETKGRPNIDGDGLNARNLAQAFDQNENSQGIGAWMSFVAQADTCA